MGKKCLLLSLRGIKGLFLVINKKEVCAGKRKNIAPTSHYQLARP